MNHNISKIHLEILDPKRQTLFQQFSDLKQGGVLTGGTALGLQIAHRYSYDFDFESQNPIAKNLIDKIAQLFPNTKMEIAIQSSDELTIAVEEVKITFFYYPYKPLYKEINYGGILIRNIHDIASNKAHAIGRRGVWRDYVDMFYLLKDHTNLEKIINDAQKRFGGTFSEKLFLEQLTYYDDISDKSYSLIKDNFTQADIENFLSEKVKEYIQKLNL